MDGEKNGIELLYKFFKLLLLKHGSLYEFFFFFSLQRLSRIDLIFNSCIFELYVLLFYFEIRSGWELLHRIKFFEILFSFAETFIACNILSWDLSVLLYYRRRFEFIVCRISLIFRASISIIPMKQFFL